MSKILITTDTHLGISNSSPFWIEKIKQYFEGICRYAKDENIDTLIHLGDFFDNQRSITHPVIHAGFEIGEMLDNTFKKVSILIGNHDIFYKNSLHPTSLKLFEKFNSINIIDTITSDICDEYTLTYIPWIVDYDTFFNYINSLSEEDKVKTILMGHFDINEITMNRFGRKSENQKLKPEDFQGFKMILSGHYHMPGEYPYNIKYLGSPYHQTFADEGERFTYILDSKTGELSTLKTETMPEFITMNVEKLDESKIEGNCIRLLFPNQKTDDEIQQIKDRVKSLGAIKVADKYEFTPSTENANDIDLSPEDILLSPEETVLKYINEVELPDTLKKKTLKSVIMVLFKETKDEM